jgi:hypothetical protein
MPYFTFPNGKNIVYYAFAQINAGKAIRSIIFCISKPVVDKISYAIFAKIILFF